MSNEETLTDPATPVMSSPLEIWRDYSALPRNVLLDIFSRLPHADILRGVGLVCAPWRRMAVSEPVLWRQIDLSADDDQILSGKNAPAHWQAMSRAAVHRSAGQCESFRGRADINFLAYLADRSPSLTSIHVTSWIYMTERGFVDGVIKKLPLLERLVMWRGFFPGTSEVMRAFLDYCPRLDLLDVGGCINSYALGYRTRQRCERTIRNLRLPKTAPNGCTCCIERAQDYADRHDVD
ncbi:unnamed protein product [Urochloa humidicola]